ncbi:flagellar hook-basal body complex protein [Oceanicaulis alexandrii]|uniref:flagellar hook-basal body complex protein n=1 Tax=Oceanicaulis alexandrii TaxID=153233 RepID=UPI003BB1EA50
MDNTMLIGLTRQLTLRRQMDVVANNIANANTQGFKAERMMLEPDTSYRARHQDGPNRAQFVDEWAMGRDFSQGSLTNTGRPLDLALQGDGFFMVEMDGVERFTRDGAFTLNPLGELVASDGASAGRRRRTDRAGPDRRPDRYRRDGRDYSKRSDHRASGRRPVRRSGPADQDRRQSLRRA